MKYIIWSEEEKARLKSICESGWDHVFPGYKWVASVLNSDFPNNRSAGSCRSMDRKMCRAEKK